MEGIVIVIISRQTNIYFLSKHKCVMKKKKKILTVVVTANFNFSQNFTIITLVLYFNYSIKLDTPKKLNFNCIYCFFFIKFFVESVFV